MIVVLRNLGIHGRCLPRAYVEMDGEIGVGGHAHAELASQFTGLFENINEM